MRTSKTIQLDSVRVSFFGDTQNPPECHLAQRALDDPAQQGVGVDDLQMSIPTSAIL